MEAIWDLPAWLEPTGPQVASRSLCGGHLGPPGLVGVHRAPDGLQKALWSICGFSRIGHEHQPEQLQEQHAHTHTDIYTWNTFTYTVIHRHTQTDMQTCLHAYIHTYIHTYLHTYILCIPVLVALVLGPENGVGSGYQDLSSKSNQCSVYFQFAACANFCTSSSIM